MQQGIKILLYKLGMENSFKKPSIDDVLSGFSSLLNYKNDQYGDSAGTPINVFSKQNPEEGILQRLDDKIMRIKNSKDFRKNDISDLIGYLILLCREKGWHDFEEFKD